MIISFTRFAHQLVISEQKSKNTIKSLDKTVLMERLQDRGRNVMIFFYTWPDSYHYFLLTCYLMIISNNSIFNCSTFFKSLVLSPHHLLLFEFEVKLYNGGTCVWWHTETRSVDTHILNWNIFKDFSITSSKCFHLLAITVKVSIVSLVLLVWMEGEEFWCSECQCTLCSGFSVVGQVTFVFVSWFSQSVKWT